MLNGAAIARRRDRQLHLWGGWHNAAFQRSRKLPNLASLLRKLEPLRVMSPKELRRSIVSSFMALGAKVTFRKKGEG